MRPTVVIAGGGFGGLQAARALERTLAPDAADLVLISDVNFLLYSPPLPGAAGAAVDLCHVVVPLRRHLTRTKLVIGRITAADPARRRLAVRSPDDDEYALDYDKCIIALGSVSRTLPIPGLTEHAMGLKTLPEAFALRNRLMQMLEIAESHDDDAGAHEALTFVVVGAGYAGVEGIAEMQSFAEEALPMYPRCSRIGLRWMLVEARDRLMPELSPSLAELTLRELRRSGVDVPWGRQWTR